MDSLVINIIFGHFVGDFFLQHKLMANNKYLPEWTATGWCSLHVLVYTLTVAIFASNFSPIFLLGVAIPHWIADRFSIAYRWMQLIGRNDLIPNDDPTKAAFGAIIYVTLDQTFHLGSLYILILLTQI